MFVISYLKFFASVCQNGDLVAQQFGDEVDDPTHEAERNAEQAGDERNDILRFDETDDTVHHGDKPTEEELQELVSKFPNL